MSTRMMVTAGVCGAALLTGAGFAMTAKTSPEPIIAAAEEVIPAETLALAETGTPALLEPETLPEAQPAPRKSTKPMLVAAAPQPDCQAIASADTGFNPATTPYPTRDDAGNHQVLKGAAVGAAAGAVGGELITDRAGKGAMVGAAAGAIGGHVIKKKKQKAINEQYDEDVAHWQQSKARYDTALQTCLAT